MGNTTPRPKKLAHDFIVENRAASLATVDENGTPHVAIVYCVVGYDLTLYFSSRVEGRKYLNLMQRPTVAMAFSNERHLQMLQMTGIAERIDSLEMEQEILHKLMTLRYQDPNWPLPPITLFERGATNEIAIIKVTPTEMTYANFESPDVGRYKPVFQKII